jgi:periplasmic divalent cation tolerance protein
MSFPVIIYTTFPNRDEAVSLAELLLEKHSIACANVLGDGESYFRWKEEIQCETETIMLLKTMDEKVDETVELIQQKHSYDCPAIAVLPIINGYSPFLEWIKAETN